MPNVFASTLRFIRAEDGPAPVEYAVMMALILMACIGSVNSMGVKVGSTFSRVASTLGT